MASEEDKKSIPGFARTTSAPPEKPNFPIAATLKSTAPSFVPKSKLQQATSTTIRTIPEEGTKNHSGLTTAAAPFQSKKDSGKLGVQPKAEPAPSIVSSANTLPASSGKTEAPKLRTTAKEFKPIKKIPPNSLPATNPEPPYPIQDFGYQYSQFPFPIPPRQYNPIIPPRGIAPYYNTTAIPNAFAPHNAYLAQDKPSEPADFKPAIRTQMEIKPHFPVVDGKPDTLHNGPEKIDGKVETKPEVKPEPVVVPQKSPVVQPEKLDTSSSDKFTPKSEVLDFTKNKKVDGVDPLARLKEILAGKKGGIFTESIIVQIKELPFCKKNSKLLLNPDILNRKFEKKELQTSYGSKPKRSYHQHKEYPIITSTLPQEGMKVERRDETEEEKKLKSEAEQKLRQLNEKVDTDRDAVILALNKLTVDNYPKVIEEILLLRNKSEECSRILVEVIFNKAWNEQKYIRMYGSLCQALIKDEMGVPQETKLTPKLIKQSHFRLQIIQECQNTFIKRKEAERPENPEEEMEWEYKQRLKRFGTIKFAGELLQRNLLRSDVIYNHILKELLKSGMDPNIEIDELEINSACELLESIGKELEVLSKKKRGSSDDLTKNTIGYDQVFEILEKIKARLSPDSRVRYLVINLLERKKAGWPEKKAQTEGPKTIEEIHREEDLKDIEQRSDYREYSHYDTSPRGKVAYVKKSLSSSHNMNKFEMLSTQIDDTKMDKEEFQDKLLEQIKCIIKNPSTPPAELKKAMTGYRLKEILSTIMEIINNNTSFLKIVKDNFKCLVQVFTWFDINTDYKFMKIIEQLFEFIKEHYEGKAEENLHLKSWIAHLIKHALLEYKMEPKTIRLAKDELEEYETLTGRIELLCEIIKILKVENSLSEELHESLYDYVLMGLVKKADADELNQKLLEEVKFKKDIGPPEALVSHMCEVLKKRRSVKASEDFKEPLIEPNSDITNVQIEEVFGMALVRTALKEKELEGIIDRNNEEFSSFFFDSLDLLSKQQTGPKTNIISGIIRAIEEDIDTEEKKCKVFFEMMKMLEIGDILPAIEINNFLSQYNKQTTNSKRKKLIEFYFSKAKKLASSSSPISAGKH